MAPQGSRFRWLRPWTDYTAGFDYGNQTPQQRRRKIMYTLKKSGFGWQMVFVAGFGFLTDAYDIFSINTILPMISVVYWDNKLPVRYRLGLNLATLLGSMLGQLILGHLADRFGRRKVYGRELTFTIVASLGMAISSTGVFNSISLIGLLIWWRILIGIGVGSDYPLSAVLTSEYAPAEYRDTMLAMVFFFQPFGQLVAVLVAFAATAGFKSRIANMTSCSINATDSRAVECANTVDKAWRLVAGLGAVPAIIAIYFRFTIPESVYYSLDVKGDTIQAMKDRRFFESSNESGDSFEMESVAPDDESEVENGSVVDDRGGHIPQPQIQTAAPAVKQDPQQGWFGSFSAYLRRDRNWVDLLATSFNWMLLDFTFYLLGVNSSSFVPILFGESNDPDRPAYSLLIDEERNIMESSSVGALLGSLAAITIMFMRSSRPFLRHFNSPRKVQMWGFVSLAPLFVIVGALYVTLPRTRAHVAIVVFYQLCNLFFNLGPNTTTFIIPAQVFPTQYRCTCYGISAAMGKLGSVLGQIVVTKVQGSNGLGGTMIGFLLVMLAGAALSKYITPETCDSKGNSLELDDLGERRARQAALQQREKEYREEAQEANEDGEARQRH